MNKGLFLCGLFIALFLAACGDDEVKIANQMTLYSRPDTIHLGGDLGMDSILVKGFTACEAYDAKWGTLPGDVAEEKAGFLKDFSSQGFVISSQHMRDDKRQVIACTYLIYVEKNSDGEKIDRWLPMRPEELRWRYLRVNFDQLKI